MATNSINLQKENSLPSTTPLPSMSDNEEDQHVMESINVDPSTTATASSTTANEKLTVRPNKRTINDENTSGEFFSLKNIIKNLNNEIKTLKEQLADAHSSNFIKHLSNNNAKIINNNNNNNISFLSKNSFAPLIQEIEENDSINMNCDESLNDDDNENGKTFEIVKNRIKTKNTVTNNQTINNNTNNNNSNKNKNPSKKNVTLNNNNNNSNNNNNKTNNNKNSSSSSPADAPSTAAKPKNQRRPPPLHIFGQDIKNTVTLAKGIKIQNFEIKRINANKHIVTTDTLQNYDALMTIFDEVNTKFYTYTPKELKPKTLVLRGLTETEDLNELKTDIETTHDDIQINKIIQMRSKRPDQLKKLLPLYIVQFSTSTPLNLVYNIKHLNYQKIEWQTLNKSNEIMQCKNCQRYGHTASNCNLGFRCVKCANIHEPGDCSIDNTVTKDNIFCINCKELGHPASYKGCPIYQSMLLRLKKRIEDKKKQSAAKSSPKVFTSLKVSKENGTFAEMMKGGPAPVHQQQQQQPTLSQQQQHNEIQNLTSRIDKMAKIMEQQSEQISQLLQIIGQL